jgi:predicted DNA-binding WGR domain protein
MIERDLFGTIHLVHHWGRIGTWRQEKAEEFDSEDEAGKALEILTHAKRRHGYRDARESRHTPAPTGIVPTI